MLPKRPFFSQTNQGNCSRPVSDSTKHSFKICSEHIKAADSKNELQNKKENNIMTVCSVYGQAIIVLVVTNSQWGWARPHPLRRQEVPIHTISHHWRSLQCIIFQYFTK